MPLFKSSREKRLWLYAGMVLLAIISTLIFQPPYAVFQFHEDNAAAIGSTCMLLIGLTFFVHGFMIGTSKIELTIWLGLATVYLMLFFRLGHAERTHLMEYGVLAIFIHKALMERLKHKNQRLIVALIAFMFTFTIGVLDEAIQLFLPGRVFDPIDILFNTLAAFMTIGASLILRWTRRKFSGDKSMSN